MTLVPDRAWHQFMALCASVAAANMAVWVAQLAQADRWVTTLAGVAVAGGVWLLTWRGLRRGDRGAGLLSWDGAAWWWSARAIEPQSGEVRVKIDLGAWLLLCFRPTGTPPQAVWLAASRATMGAATWRAARVALCARSLGADPDPLRA